MVFLVFYYDESKTLYRSFSTIKNFYIALYRYYVSEHINVGKHVVLLSSIKLYIANMDGVCYDVVAVIFT